MIICCHVCNADPAGRWKQPPAIIFCDPSQEDGSERKDPDFAYACRSHLSARQEKEIQEREKDDWKKEELR
jgi:hypothetical protein